jgi:hypothetical protein
MERLLRSGCVNSVNITAGLTPRKQSTADYDERIVAG